MSFIVFPCQFTWMCEPDKHASFCHHEMILVLAERSVKLIFLKKKPQEEVAERTIIPGTAGPLTAPVAPNSNGLGSLVNSSLEMSNVDLAGQLTSLITTQRGYEANTKVITTSDEILQDLINLKR